MYKLGSCTEEERIEVKKALVSLFNDNPGAPFSLHSICEKGREKGFGVTGQYWKQNMTLASAIELFNQTSSMFINKRS